MNRIKVIIMFILVTAFLLSGFEKDWSLYTENYTDSMQLSSSDVWVVYWDLDNAKNKIKEINGVVTGISCFAAYFNEDSRLFIPDSLTKFKNDFISENENEQIPYYLTIVNDMLQGKVSSLKDTNLLRSLFENEYTMDLHIEQIIKLANTEGYDGIEIDYEAIRSDMELWEQFIVFCERLNQETKACGLKLRIILEPNAPLEELSFQEGPEYVMMCYNLYGTDARKGPKANDKFIRDMLKKMDSLPGKKSFALATGGYHWVGDEKGKQITEKAAIELAKSTKATVYRSNNSGALSFQYRDEDGSENTVWYADAETLLRWQNSILSGGNYGIMLWRIE